MPFSASSEDINEIRRVYSTLSENQRIFVPAQAAREYLDNRPSKIADLYKNLKDARSHNFPKLNNYNLISDSETQGEINEARDKIELSIKEYRKSIDKAIEKVKSWTWDDPVSTMYNEVLGPTVLSCINHNYKEVMNEVKIRSDLKIPPGYKDSNKEHNKEGDYLIWQEILELAKKHDNDVILVSHDNKTDWFHRSAGEALYPRFELVDEFRRETNGKSFHIINLSEMLKLFGADDKFVSSIRTSEKTREKVNSYTAFDLDDISQVSDKRRSNDYEVEIDQIFFDCFKGNSELNTFINLIESEVLEYCDEIKKIKFVDHKNWNKTEILKEFLAIGVDNQSNTLKSFSIKFHYTHEGDEIQILNKRTRLIREWFGPLKGSV